jgi:hypothetical protein
VEIPNPRQIQTQAGYASQPALPNLVQSVENQMWIDYDLYQKAEANYIRYVESRVPRHFRDYEFFTFLLPYLGPNKEGEPIKGAVNFHLRPDGTVHHIVHLSKQANEVVKALAGPYSYALLEAHYSRIKDESQQTSDQSSQDDL